MTRAFALLADRHQELRLRIVEWPWLRLYERPCQVAKICVRREVEGVPWLFFLAIQNPEHQSLDEIQAQLDHASSAPIAEIPDFAAQVRLSSLPSLVRRACWWIGMNFPNTWGNRVGGTFGVTSVAGLGAISIHPPSAGLTVVTFGRLKSNGKMRVTFVYDHRIFDGATIAEFLQEFEVILQTEIVAELQRLCPQRKAS